MTAVSTLEAFLAFLILAVVYGMCWLMWWDIRETCREQVGAGGVLGDEPAVCADNTIYDWEREGAS